jgi:hypothetical protein
MQHRGAAAGRERVAVSVLREAAELVAGDRNDAYGDAAEDLAATAEIWTVVLRRRGLLAAGARLGASEVALCMAGLKLSREAHQTKRDNCTDGAGYFGLAAEVTRVEVTR